MENNVSNRQRGLLEEAGKHLALACIASSQGKSMSDYKIKGKRFDPRIMKEFWKTAKLYNRYDRKYEEINKAIDLIDKANIPTLGSYVIAKEKDQNNVGCYGYNFKLNINGEDCIFRYHVPVKDKGRKVKEGKGNYPEFDYKECFSNNDAIDVVSEYEGTYKSGLSLLELYA